MRMQLRHADHSGTIPSSTAVAPADPRTLLNGSAPDRHGRRWYAARTFSRQEKLLSRELQLRGILHYLPLRVQRLTYRGRAAVTYVPVFSGMVFVFVNPAEHRACFSTGRVASILTVADQ